MNLEIKEFYFLGIFKNQTKIKIDFEFCAMKLF